jgi:hypothetical protein
MQSQEEGRGRCRALLHCEGAGAGRAGRSVDTGVAINVSKTAVIFEVLAAGVVHEVAVSGIVGVAVGSLLITIVAR